MKSIILLLVSNTNLLMNHRTVESRISFCQYFKALLKALRLLKITFASNSCILSSTLPLLVQLCWCSIVTWLNCVKYLVIFFTNNYQLINYQLITSLPCISMLFISIYWIYSIYSIYYTYSIHWIHWIYSIYWIYWIYWIYSIYSIYSIEWCQCNELTMNWIELNCSYW